MSWRWIFVTAVLALGLTMAVPAQESDNNQTDQQNEEGRRGREGRGGWGGGRGDWNPEQFRQRMMDGIKEQLAATDEEWQVLQPKIETLMAAQRAGGRGGMMMTGGGRRGGGGGWGGGGDQPDTELSRASRDLRTTLENEAASAQEIQDRLAAYRAARDKQAAELAKARAELKELVTQRQEAALVLMGLLE